MNGKPLHGVRHHERGAAAILAMMFLVIFGSLAVAMAIVSQGNLSVASAHLKINRSLAAAETGTRFMIFRTNQAAQAVLTTDGLIDGDNAPGLWDQARVVLLNSLTADGYAASISPTNPAQLQVGPVAISPSSPTFTVTFTPHPLAGEDYDGSRYQRPPYADLNPPVSSAAPLGPTWIRLRVAATDGPVGHQVVRSIKMDFKLDKKIPFAMLSKNRIMIGRNVMIDGTIGSRFMETHLENGHPVQMEGDFRGLDSNLDTSLALLLNTLIDYDMDGDNRLNLANPSEATITDIPDLAVFDTNADGYVDDYDFFLGHFDGLNGGTADGQITADELDTVNNINAAQLLELIDTFGDPNRVGYGDGLIDEHDRYAKIRGQVMIAAAMQGWNDGAAGGDYQNYFQGPIHPDFGKAPLTFGASDTALSEFTPADFDVSSFRNAATGDLVQQVSDQYTNHDPADPDSPNVVIGGVTEAVPFGSAYPYDYYTRPVIENMTFTDVTVPLGTNALFRNCTFIGVTFVETSTTNADPNFNYAGMSEADGTPKYPDLTATVNGTVVSDTKAVSNNLRFDGCTFEGAIVSDSPPAYTHVRNKLAFTGRTRFDIDNSVNLTADEKALFKRSTILAPHYSVEMGTFVDPTSTTETVKLSGTIVAGVLDMRGQIDINGTILTTFEPVSNQLPVIGETSPQFNTTLGYFASAAGDLEAELPATGLGVVKLRYDPNLALPDGINGPIQITPVFATYVEGGAQ